MFVLPVAAMLARKSLRLKQPVLFSSPECSASSDFKMLASRIIGQEFKEGIELKEKVRLSPSDFFLK